MDQCHDLVLREAFVLVAGSRLRALLGRKSSSRRFALTCLGGRCEVAEKTPLAFGLRVGESRQLLMGLLRVDLAMAEVFRAPIGEVLDGSKVPLRSLEPHRLPVQARQSETSSFEELL